jgi:tetratricopeptide (TPR) repeat protein
MQALAAPGTILAAEATHRLVEGHVRSEATGPLEVRGVSEPVRAYRLLGPQRRTRLEARAERGLTALVGRERELEILRDRLARARAGHGQVVGIVGEPGVGKSRLVHEFRASMADETLAVLQGDCRPHATPYAPIAEALRSAFGIGSDAGPAEVEDNLRRGVMSADPALTETFPLLREVCGLPADETTRGLDPRTRRQRTFEAIRAIVVAVSLGRPHAIVIEDLQWIDQTSEECLAFLVESLAGMRVLLLTTSRPGHAVRWADRAYFTQVALDVLDEEGTAAVLAACLGTRALPAGLARLVHDKVEGNPLFVEEVARALLERGTLVPSDGGVRWAGAPAVDVPATGQDIIRARIDALPEAAKRVLQTAAVIGRRFPGRLLARVAERPGELEEHLVTLRHAELIHETRVFPEAEYAFKHGMVQEVAYDTLLARRRRELHAATGRALEDLLRDRVAEQYEMLAHHFFTAGDRPKAIEYLTKSGERAAAVFAGLEAAARYEQALALVDAQDRARRAQLLHRIAEVSFFHRDPETTVRYSHSALEAHERLGDRRGAMGMHLNLAGIYMSQGWDGAREDRALGHLEAAAAIAEDDPDSVQKGLIFQRTAHLYLHRGAPATALAWAKRAVDLFTRIGVPMGTALGTASSYVGRVDEGVAYNEANWPGVVKMGNPLVISILAHELTLTLALARAPGRARAAGERGLQEFLALPAERRNAYFESMIRRPLALALILAGHAAPAAGECRFVDEVSAETLLGCFWEDTAAVALHWFRQGDWERARRVAERTIAVMTERNQVAAVSACAYVLGCLDLAEGRRAEAEARLARSLEICRGGGNVLFELWVLPVLGELYLETDRRDRAAGCVDRGEALLRPAGSWYGLPAGIHLARGMLARERREWVAAEAAFERAVEVNREHDLPWDEAKALSEWGRMLVARAAPGDRARARERSGAALDLFERVGARRHAEEVRRLAAASAAGGC